jgi:hypothetical protein
MEVSKHGVKTRVVRRGCRGGNDAQVGASEGDGPFFPMREVDRVISVAVGEFDLGASASVMRRQVDARATHEKNVVLLRFILLFFPLGH